MEFPDEYSIFHCYEKDYHNPEKKFFTELHKSLKQEYYSLVTPLVKRGVEQKYCSANIPNTENHWSKQPKNITHHCTLNLPRAI